MERIKRYFFNKQFSFRYNKIMTEFEMDLLNFKSFFNFKERKKRNEFKKKLKDYFEKNTNNNSYRTRLSEEREDPTIDQYISKHGGIKSHVDNSIHTTKQSYLQHLKQNNCHIHE